MGNQTIAYTKTVMVNALSRTKREKSVLMFHVGRSGSTVLGDLFNQTPNIFWDSEIFMLNRMPAVVKPLRRLIYSHPTFLVGIRRMRTSKAIYGLEVKPAHIGRIGIALPQFVAEMKTIGFDHFILLRRRNQLRVIISHLVANQQGYWHQRTQDVFAQTTHAKVKIDVNTVTMGTSRYRKPLSLLDHLRTVEQEFDELRALLDTQFVLDLVYEDHIQNDPTDAYRKVCGFLDTAPSMVQVHLKRTNPLSVKDLISNFEEVACVLTGSPYEWMLYE